MACHHHQPCRFRQPVMASLDLLATPISDRAATTPLHLDLWAEVEADDDDVGTSKCPWGVCDGTCTSICTQYNLDAYAHPLSECPASGSSLSIRPLERTQDCIALQNKVADSSVAMYTALTIVLPQDSFLSISEMLIHLCSHRDDEWSNFFPGSFEYESRVPGRPYSWPVLSFSYPYEHWILPGDFILFREPAPIL